MEQLLRAGAGRAHPVPAEAHVRLRHVRVRGDGEAHPRQGEPAFRLRRARPRQAVQGKGQGPRQVQARSAIAAIHFPFHFAYILLVRIGVVDRFIS